MEYNNIFFIKYTTLIGGQSVYIFFLKKVHIYLLKPYAQFFMCAPYDFLK